MSQLPVTIYQSRLEFERNTEIIIGTCPAQEALEKDDNNNRRTYDGNPACPDSPPGTDVAQEEVHDSQDLLPDSQPLASSQVQPQTGMEGEQSDVQTQSSTVEGTQSVQPSSLAREADRSSSRRDVTTPQI